jgi:putative hemolysin
VTLVWALALLVAVAISFLFSGFETGIYALNRVRLRIRLGAGSAAARRVRDLLADPALLIAVILVGNNVTNFLASFFTQELLSGAVPPGEMALWSTLVLTPVLFVFGEVTPKDCFRKRADAWVYTLAPLFRPMVRAGAVLRRGLERLFGIDRRDVRRDRETFATRGRIELSLLESAEEGVLTEEQSRLARNILRLRSTTLRSVMKPVGTRPVLGGEATVSEVVACCRGAGLVRLPFLGGGGAPGGMVNLHDLIGLPPDARVADRVRPLLRLEGAMTAVRALVRLRAERQGLAAVVQGDEVLGWVTMRDLGEEIVGELQDW